MKKQPFRSPIKNGIDDENESRNLRSTKSLKKHSHSFDKSSGSKSLPNKKSKHGLDLFETKSKIRTNASCVTKNETQQNCRKSLLKRFDDVQDKDSDEDIPLGELLGDKNNLISSSSKAQDNMRSPDTPKRNLRPRRSPRIISDDIEKEDTNSDDITMDSGTINVLPKELNILDPQLNNSKVMLSNISCTNKDSSRNSELSVTSAKANGEVALGLTETDSNKSIDIPKEEMNDDDDPFHNNTNKLSNMEKFDLDENNATNNFLTPSKHVAVNCHQNVMKVNDSPMKPFEGIPLTPSCYNSPSTGILRKRKLQDEAYCSPSPKMRRVAFSEIVSTLEIPNRHDSFKKSLKHETREQSFKNEGNLQKNIPLSTNKENGAPIFPELTNSSTPIEAILPRITTTPWVRGLKNLLSAKNIKTIGDMAAATETDLETLPISQPRASRIRDALQHWLDQTNKKAAATLKETSDNHETSNQSDVNASTNKTITKEGTRLQDLIPHVDGHVNKLTREESISSGTIASSNSVVDVKDTLDKIIEEIVGVTSTNIQITDTNETSNSCQDVNISDKREQDTSVSHDGIITPETSTGEVALKMFNDLAEILQSKDGHKFSREQLKIMFSKLIFIQSTISERINSLL